MTIRRTMAMFLALLLGLGAAGGARAAEPIKTLLLSGANNHKWQETTPELKKILEDSGRFKVDVTDNPEKMTAAMLAPYDLVLSNWTNYPKVDRIWGPEAEQALFNFVRQGKGLALFHAAAATFPEWPEFGKFLGAGWVPRYPGRESLGSGHGRRHTFKVVITDKNHPIMAGLSDFYLNDELWHRLAKFEGPHILSQAFSALDKDGTGKDEPMTIIHDEGKGRVFFLVPGHDVVAMSNPAWRTLMLRGAEWAATGKVTMPVIQPWPSTPELVPTPPPAPPKAKAPAKTAPKARKAGAAKKAAVPAAQAPVPAALPASPDALIKSLADYQDAEARISLVRAELLLDAAAKDAPGRAALAGKLALAIQGPATPDAKRFYLKTLGRVGTAKEAAQLAALLADKDLGAAALAALQQISAPEAAAALREALPKAQGATLTGIINALGAKADTAAVPPVAGQLRSQDLAVAQAAVDALGKIPGDEAFQALTSDYETIDKALWPALGTAVMRHIEAMKAATPAEEMAGIYQTILLQSAEMPLTRAAVVGLLETQPDRAAALALEALKGTSRQRQLGAIDFIRSHKNVPPTADLAAAVAGTAPRVQVALLTVLGERGDTAGLTAALQGAESKNADVRQAGLGAVSRLGGASVVGVLAKMTEKKTKEELAPIHAALVGLRGPGVNAEIVDLLTQMPAPTRQELIQVLAERDARDAAPDLLAAAGSADAGLRAAAIKALGALAGTESLPGMITLLNRELEDRDREALETALAECCRRAEDHPATAWAVAGRIAAATTPAKGSLIKVLGALGGPEALQVVREQLEDRSPTVHEASLRALAAWPDGAPAEDLLRAAAKEQDEKIQRLALRGFGALIGKAEGLAPARRTSLLREALAMSAADEKKALLAQLGRTASLEALALARESLADAALADEAGLAMVQIAEGLLATNAPAGQAALKEVAATAKNETIKRAAQAALDAGTPLPPKKGPNLARGAKAASLDGLQPDGQGRPAPAAIDGNPDTYWDETDGQPLYRIEVTLPKPAAVEALRITGYHQNSFSPKDFDVLCDGKLVRSVTNARYRDAVTEVLFPTVTCRTIELKITGYTGKSPAIRELEIYGPEK